MISLIALMSICFTYVSVFFFTSKHNLFHSDFFFVQEAELAMLERLPLIGALDAPSLTEKKSLERSARLQELLYFCVNEDLRPSGRLTAL